jgi:hypothetical protein
MKAEAATQASVNQGAGQRRLPHLRDTEGFPVNAGCHCAAAEALRLCNFSRRGISGRSEGTLMSGGQYAHCGTR